MLSIKRRSGESFKIGDDITVFVEIKHGQIYVGIEAPPDVKILRSELVGTEPQGKRK